MLAGPQFSQMALFHESQAQGGGRSAAATRNLSVPRGGQYELPFKTDVGAATTPEPAERSAEQRLLGGEHPVDVHHGGTYPMLMRAGEVRQQFQALDGDRNDGDYYEGDGSAGNSMMTVNGTHVASHAGTARVMKAAQHGITTGITRVNTGDVVHRVRKRLSDLPETDDALYDRKYDEANESSTHDEYGDTRMSGSDSVPHGAGLADQISAHGYDLQHPVSLPTGHGSDSSWSNTASRGKFGKYQVLGGHHRVAVMERDRPNDLMSVQWHGSIDQAKQSNSY